MAQEIDTNQEEEMALIESELLAQTPIEEENKNEAQELYEARKEAFENKIEGKREAFERLADKNRREQESRNKTAHNIADAIPFGQPILVGHHSEKRHRRDIERINTNYEKGFEAGQKAEYYENKIGNLDNSRVISSDDPDATTKLKAKVEAIKNTIEQIKEHNKKASAFTHLALFPEHYRSNDCKDFVFTNTNGSYKEYAKINEQKEVTWLVKKPKPEIKAIVKNYVKTGKLEQKELTKEQTVFEAYHLQNLNSEKRRLEKRIEELQAKEKIQDVDETVNSVNIVTDKIENRLRLYFPGKPDQETITQLKRNGFHWSPFNKAWQRMISDYAIDKAREIAGAAKNA